MISECRVHPAKRLPGADVVRRLEALASALVSDVSGRWAGAPGLLPVSGRRRSRWWRARPSRFGRGPATTSWSTRPSTSPGPARSLSSRPAGRPPGRAGRPHGSVRGHSRSGRAGRRRRRPGPVGPGAGGAAGLRRRYQPPRAVKDGPGEIRGTVAVAGLVVSDGDLVVADKDGVAVVPRSRCTELLAASEAKRAAEAEGEPRHRRRHLGPGLDRCGTAGAGCSRAVTRRNPTETTASSGGLPVQRTDLSPGWTVRAVAGDVPAGIGGAAVPGDGAGVRPHRPPRRPALSPIPTSTRTRRREPGSGWPTGATRPRSADQAVHGGRGRTWSSTASTPSPGSSSTASVWRTPANMHRTYRFDVARPAAAGGPNTLAVTFRSPVRPPTGAGRSSAPRPHVNHHPYNAIRKMACNFGWDWGPDLVTPASGRPSAASRGRAARLAAVRPLVDRRRRRRVRGSTSTSSARRARTATCRVVGGRRRRRDRAAHPLRGRPRSGRGRL